MIVYRICGLFLVVLGIAFNKWTLEALVILDGRLESIWVGGGIVALQIALVSLGGWVFARASRLKLPSFGEWILIATAVVIALGVGEFAARLTRGTRPAPATYVGQYESRASANIAADPQTGWRMQPSREFQLIRDGHAKTYRSNGQGFRSPREFDSHSSSIVALVGDSFTWGTGVNYEATFGSVLEAKLAGAEVYNFAMPGFGIDQMWMSARHQALPRKPELLVVAFIDDDFDRSLTAYRRREGFTKPRFVMRGGRLQPQTRPNPLRLTLHSHSALWNLLSTASKKLKPFEEWWALNLAMLESIAAESNAAGVPVLFVRLPMASRAPLDRLGQHLNGKGLNFIDIGTDAAGLPRDMHLAVDGHLSPAGHLFVASTIVKWMTKGAPHLLAATAANVHAK